MPFQIVPLAQSSTCMAAASISSSLYLTSASTSSVTSVPVNSSLALRAPVELSSASSCFRQRFPFAFAPSVSSVSPAVASSAAAPASASSIQKFSVKGNVERRLGQVQQNSSTSSRGELYLFSAAPMLIVPAIAESAGYSQASYYTSLGLFIISVPGVWSLIKRSTKSKIVRKTFVVPGPNAENGKAPGLVAGEITSSLTRNNFSITDRGEVVTFEGVMVPSRGQAAFLSFCTAISLGCVALVLTITNPEVGSSWYYLTLLSPLAGLYYWTRASRKEEIKVKLVVSDDEASTDVILQGDDEQIDRLRRELELMEKGMVYVKGIFEQ